MKNKIFGLFFVLAGYLIFLLVTLPATVVLTFVTLPNQLSLTQVTGTIWKGHIQQVEYNRQTLEELDWEIELLPLLTGALEVDLRFGDGVDTLQGQGTVGVSFSGVYVHDVTASASSEWILAASNMPLPISTTGRVKLDIDEFEPGAPWCNTLTGQVNWSNAGIESLLGNIDLNKPSAKLSCTDGELIAKIKQSSSQLKLSGTAKLQAMGKYTFDGVLVPTAELPESVRSNLRYIGRPNNNGEYQLHYSGRI